jgi:hypothetical protein
MDNPETPAKSGTQDTGQAKHKDTIQHRKQSRMDNQETLAKSGTHRTKTSKTHRHNTTQKTFKNGQPRDAGKIRHTRHRTKTSKTQKHNTTQKTFKN